MAGREQGDGMDVRWDRDANHHPPTLSAASSTEELATPDVSAGDTEQLILQRNNSQNSRVRRTVSSPATKVTHLPRTTLPDLTAGLPDKPGLILYNPADNDFDLTTVNKCHKKACSEGGNNSATGVTESVGSISSFLRRSIRASTRRLRTWRDGLTSDKNEDVTAMGADLSAASVSASVTPGHGSESNNNNNVIDSPRELEVRTLGETLLVDVTDSTNSEVGPSGEGGVGSNSGGGIIVNVTDLERRRSGRRSVRFTSHRASVESQTEPVPDVVVGIEPTAPSTPPRREGRVIRSRPRSEEEASTRDDTEEARRRLAGLWTYDPCAWMACLSCTLGLFSICRFSFLCFQFGGVFVVQFLVLSLLFGFSLLTFHMTLGQHLGLGIVDMWKISPIFQGVGIAAMFSEFVLSIYTVVPISWLFTYFRDSFVVANGFTYKWGECNRFFRPKECGQPFNTSVITKAVPDYFNAKVLQRLNLNAPMTSGFGDLKFEHVFNQAVIWMIVFICLSKGVKSYGRILIISSILPLLVFLIIAIQLLQDSSWGTELIFSRATNMAEFFSNSSSWLAAGRETFLIWGLHGAALMQITSHNKLRHNLQRDAAIVILITLSVLLMAAFLSCACFFAINKEERMTLIYSASSFELDRYTTFLTPGWPSVDTPTGLLSSGWPPLDTPTSLRHTKAVNLVAGIRLLPMGRDSSQASGYMVTRLATELFPAASAYQATRSLSPFWVVIFYFMLIIFGLAQQLAVWRCVIEGIVAINSAKLQSWETCITFVACSLGFLLGLPFTTELGIFAVYFMDFCVGSAWWIMILYALEMLALILLKGRPLNGEKMVYTLAVGPFARAWIAPLLLMSWNFLLPLGLLALSVSSFVLAGMGDMFGLDESTNGYRWWPSWARKLGSFIQLAPLVIVLATVFIQTYRYLTSSPGTYTERLQMLIRPRTRSPPDGQSLNDSATRPAVVGGTATTPPREDPPPKYTPPPSYNTATGARLLKTLNSLRRSIRGSLRRRPTISQQQEDTSNGASNRRVTTVELLSVMVNEELPPATEQEFNSASTEVLPPTTSHEFNSVRTDILAPSTASLTQPTNSVPRILLTSAIDDVSAPPDYDLVMRSDAA